MCEAKCNLEILCSNLEKHLNPDGKLPKNLIRDLFLLFCEHFNYISRENGRRSVKNSNSAVQEFKALIKYKPCQELLFGNKPNWHDALELFAQKHHN